MFVFPVRVYYEDTDAGGVVYHSRYLNFMERARTEWLRAAGFAQSALREQEQVLFVVHSMQLQFKKPARLDDQLQVVSRLIEMKRGSFSCQQQILCGETILIEAQVKVACVDADLFKPTGIPARLKIALESS
ncbi:MAG: tol-pal system-associated acyl-CoA thioesterase [Methylotenera sp.]|jgi:tol-pal system-associated acyl-CoA thioesterase|uniref:tol-pal system-associated acyl-CoA thioesterase n=1 Tax=Methylophilaceae TaxID=32011 RepID=UPI000D3F089F|nr:MULTISPECIES: tol-pal system-associated acyl-CoA thioesterase [Methylophilaceae]PPC83176.1 MAG: tol-pal system-associated acyl-CoA thioesterase [Methylotenera sp.]TXI43363.1 MAG: tol-pal system-associated acyl-CoA thioesterase [Methylophilus sp.]